MKVFRHVKLHGSTAQLGAIREKLAQWVPTAAWRRDAEMQKRHGSAPDAIVFEYTGAEAPSALVWLFDEPYGARVTNIVPRGAGSLSRDEYNTIAAEFVHDVVDPLASQLAVGIDLGPTDKSIEDLLPASVAAALRQFSSSANRATGAAHSQDAEKWDRFIILAHREHAELAPNLLRRWLVEDEHWDDEQAYDLSLEYESARRLLASNDDFKAA
jgi:hypothetical protein